MCCIHTLCGIVSHVHCRSMHSEYLHSSLAHSLTDSHTTLSSTCISDHKQHPISISTASTPCAHSCCTQTLRRAHAGGRAAPSQCAPCLSVATLNCESAHMNDISRVCITLSILEAVHQVCSFAYASVQFCMFSLDAFASVCVHISCTTRASRT